MVFEVCWRAADQRRSGDFFESAVRSDGTVGLVLGDAPGSGTAAAPLADRLAEVARAALAGGERSRQVLTALDAETQTFGPDVVATSLCAVVDPCAGSMELASAGHLPALFVRPVGLQRAELPGSWASELAHQVTEVLGTPSDDAMVACVRLGRHRTGGPRAFRGG